MKVIETKSQIITLREDGIMSYVAKPIDRQEVEDARENIESAKVFLNNKSKPSLVDLRKTKFLTVEARKLYASKENAKNISFCALLVDGPVSRMVGNFFIGINKTNYPTKLFNSEEKAINWLKSKL